MSALYLSRARLREERGVLGPILFPDDPAHKMAISHRLVWTLFPPDTRKRPFLYRETAPSHASGRAARGEYIILSSEPPDDSQKLFDLDTKPFSPRLEKGEILQFSLRANPTVQKSEDVNGRRKTRRHDVVMHALFALPKEERGRARLRTIRSTGLDWLARQGERSGFALPEPEGIKVDGYEQFDADPENRRPKASGWRKPGHSRIDFEGLLQVTDPELLIASLGQGFGRARAFGHGLMLIRRA